MRLVDLKKKYNKIPVTTLKSYVNADRVAIVNNDDNDLQEIRIKLPEVPELHLIHGFGLNAKYQKFEREDYPNRLKNLTNHLLNKKRQKSSKPQEVFITVEELWNYIGIHRDEYYDEIEFIKFQWYHRLYGKWYFINGKPTYINGWHWFYLNYYKLRTGGLPDYRDRDRRWFLAQKYIYDETVDENGINYDRRLHRGTNNLDGRRTGKTSRAASIHLNLITMNLNWEGGIQGLDKNNGETVFQKHIVYPFRSLPFFFKPVHEGSTDMKVKLVLKPSAVVIGSRGTILDDRVGLESSIDFAPTAAKTFYDKRRLNFYHCDEPGKTIQEDVAKRHEVVKECVAQGTEIIGFMIYTTTVEETTIAAMESYSKICEGSHYGDRIDGQTSSGLINIFMPSYDGLEGFIDEYGASVINTPKKPIMGINGKLIKEGSLDYLNKKRKQYLDNKDFGGLAGFKRRFPISYRECFTPSAEDVNFNREILETRISELKFDTKMTINGDLEWIHEFGGEVKFVARTDGLGRWNISRKPLNGEANQWYFKDELKYPMNPLYTIAADPFKYSKTKGRRQSDGGISVFLDYNPRIDGEKDISEWDTFNFVADYEFRPPTTEEFSEDVLKASIYWSGMCYPERNIDTVIKDFERWNYQGYLLYDIITDKNGFQKISETPGYNTSTEARKQQLMRNMRDYVQLHGMRCNHLKILESCMQLKGIEDMTNKDLFVASTIALEGTKSKFKELRDQMDSDFDLKQIYPNL